MVTAASRVGVARVAALTGAYLLAAAYGAVRTGNLEFIFYIGVMFVLIGAVWVVHRAISLPEAALWALSVWGLLHMAGGLLPPPAGWPAEGGAEVLYGLWIVPGRIKYDHLVHAWGFGVTTWVCWLGLSASLERAGVAATPGFGRLVLVWVAGMGFGALNEVVEFAATLLVPDTNVGGYRNTGWDLVSNLVGATVAVVAIALTRRVRSDSEAADTEGEG
jgi:hypothetical protein